MMEQSQGVVQVASEAGLLSYIASVGILGGVTMAAAEGLGRVLKAQKAFQHSKSIKLNLAILFGPSLSLAAYGAGFLPSPAGGTWGWVFSGLLGLLGTLGAKGVTDFINVVKKA